MSFLSVERVSVWVSSSCRESLRHPHPPRVGFPRGAAMVPSDAPRRQFSLPTAMFFNNE